MVVNGVSAVDVDSFSAIYSAICTQNERLSGKHISESHHRTSKGTPIKGKKTHSIRLGDDSGRCSQRTAALDENHGKTVGEGRRGARIGGEQEGGRLIEERLAFLVGRAEA
jgi:hypothetical protein